MQKFKLLNIITLSLTFFCYSNAQSNIIHTSDFEEQETSLPDGWSATADTVVITNDVSYSGTQSVRTPNADPENIVGLSFNPSVNSVLFADYYVITSWLPVSNYSPSILNNWNSMTYKLNSMTQTIKSKIIKS